VNGFVNKTGRRSQNSRECAALRDFHQVGWRHNVDFFYTPGLPDQYAMTQ